MNPFPPRPAEPSPVSSVLVWFRRDLRLQDHTALSAALKLGVPVWCVFCFDTDILDGLPRADRRVDFIHRSVEALHHSLATAQEGAGLIVLHGKAGQEIPRLALSLGVSHLFTHHDDEPASLRRDAQVQLALQQQGLAWASFKDHVVLERSEVLSQGGKPYSVFTPYKRAWLKTIEESDRAEREVLGLTGRLGTLPSAWARRPSLQEMGFEPHPMDHLIGAGADDGQRLLADFLGRASQYQQLRDFPALKGPSYLSVHLRFGTLGVRQALRAVWAQHEAGDEGASCWVSELVWRDFYHQILHHHPHVTQRSFKPEYDRIQWEQGPEAQKRFQAWAQGQTGYPLVDAAMRQLLSTGYMHNRLRMVSASFLVKDLGIDWRWGEAHFALHLNDFDLAANNGGWQWAASSGCDAQPYFRIFNPVSQSEKFDPQARFIRRYVPELAGLPDAALHAPWLCSPLELQASGLRLGVHYPEPVVDHAQARLATLERYAVVKQGGAPEAEGGP
jgi:deoxyribodipyrimidine photo-lyase